MEAPGLHGDHFLLNQQQQLDVFTGKFLAQKKWRYFPTGSYQGISKVEKLTIKPAQDMMKLIITTQPQNLALSQCFMGGKYNLFQYNPMNMTNLIVM